MKKTLLKQFCVVLMVTMLFSIVPLAASATTGGIDGTEPITIHLIGDSKVCDYSLSAAPQYGWGTAMYDITNQNVTIVNHAVSGMSSHSCYDSIWTDVKADIKEGDYLFISFGHNDMNAEKTDFYAPIATQQPWADGTFQSYITKFIEEAETLGAVPVVVSSVETLSYLDIDTLKYPATTDLKKYAAAAKEAAEAKDVEFIDINALSQSYIEGLADIDEIYSHYMISVNGTDGTHLTQKGATAMARIILSNSSLSAYMLPEGETRPEPINYRMNETFSWDNPVKTTTAGGRYVVSQAGTTIASSGSYHADLTSASDTKYKLTTDIVTDDSAHGKVMQLSSDSETNYGARRGITINRKWDYSNGGFRVAGFDFKVLGGEGYSPQYVRIFLSYGKNTVVLSLSDLNFIANEFKAFSNSDAVMSTKLGEFVTAIEDDGNLKADKWYNVKMLLNENNWQFDLFINDVLIAQDCDMPVGLKTGTSVDSYNVSPENGFTIGLYTSTGTGIKAFRLDNVCEYEVTDEQAAAMAKQGVEKYFGNGLYTSEKIEKLFNGSSKYMSLPFGGMTGYSYFISSTNKVLCDSALHTPNTTYTWQVTGNTDFETERTTFDWNRVLKDKTKPPYTIKAEPPTTGYEYVNVYNGRYYDLNYDLSNDKFVDASDSSVLLTAGDLAGTVKVSYKGTDALPYEKNAGRYPDKSFGIKVDITKGTATESVTKNITLQRPIVSGTPEGITIGVPSMSEYDLTSDNVPLAVYYNYSYIQNDTDDVFEYNTISAYYDADNNLVCAIINPVEIAANSGRTVGIASQVSMALYGIKCENKATLDGLSEEQKLQIETASALEKSVKTVKWFVWSDGLSPYGSAQERTGKRFVAE